MLLALSAGMHRFIFPALLCIGCSSSNISSDELDDALSQYGDSSADVIKPYSGSWQYTSTDIASDTCANLTHTFSRPLK